MQITPEGLLEAILLQERYRRMSEREFKLRASHFVLELPEADIPMSSVNIGIRIQHFSDEVVYKGYSYFLKIIKTQPSDTKYHGVSCEVWLYLFLVETLRRGL